ncbi:myosin-3-like isoform X6 [Alosa alosa]|uniref:myosin-3-like isoform X6 n=1 Tax=Alosa alosa TaxID=278164 RepID=UPI00201532CB|nr:myosin-3-like isoform X6 [Alosa alosa]
MNEVSQHMDLSHTQACIDLERATQIITQALQHEVVKNQELCMLIRRLEEKEAETGRSLTEQVESNKELQLKIDKLQKHLEEKHYSLIQANQTVVLLKTELRCLRQQLQSQQSNSDQDVNERPRGGEIQIKQIKSPSSPLQSDQQTAADEPLDWSEQMTSPTSQIPLMLSDCQNLMVLPHSQTLLDAPVSGIKEENAVHGYEECRQYERADPRTQQTISSAGDVKTEQTQDEQSNTAPVLSVKSDPSSTDHVSRAQLKRATVMHNRRDADQSENDGVSPSTLLHGRDQPLSASPQTSEKKLLDAISGLSHQLTLFAADVHEQFTHLSNSVNSRLLSTEDGSAALELKNCVEETNSKKRRRVHNPKIAETVRRLHNSETNCRRYKPEQGLTSPHNEAVTSYLLEAMSASPDLHNADSDSIVSACKTYYETVRRNFRYKQPDLASQAETAKSSARSRSRRKRLLEARQSVLAEDEVELWKSATIDLMSDEEDGIVDGVSGWIVRPPSFRSQELTELCATLQSRLEAIPKYRATHHRRLLKGPNSDRMPPVTYSS